MRKEELVQALTKLARQEAKKAVTASRKTPPLANGKTIIANGKPLVANGKTPVSAGRQSHPPGKIPRHTPRQ